MIEGKTRTEAQYRATQLDSSSSLKVFSQDRRKYYKLYVLGEKVPDDESDTKASVMGRVVETLILEPELFDSRFCMSCIAKAPTGLMEAFVEALYKHTKNATNEKGELSRSFEEIAKDAHKDSGFKHKFETVLEKFSGSDAEIYYREILDIRSKGLTVVTGDDVTNAERIVTELKTNDITSKIINQVSDNRYDVYNQLQIEGYEIDGLQLKSMIDKIIVDNVKKTISVYDLKCVWAVEGFYDQYYLYRRAYIQAYLYLEAARYWKSEVGLEDYTVEIPAFIVCDSINYYIPLIYTLYNTDINEAYSGFVHQGTKYPGVETIIKDLIWAKKNAEWRISRVNYENSGIVHIKG